MDRERNANADAGAEPESAHPIAAPGSGEGQTAQPIETAAPLESAQATAEAKPITSPPKSFAYYVAIGKLRRRYAFLASEDLGKHFGRSVIVDAEYGLDLGLLRERCAEIPPETAGAIVRLAGCSDLEHAAKQAAADAECSAIFEASVREEKLEMKLVGIDHSFEQARVTFYYQASGRVDFRQLVKVLASKLRRRIELYQLNLRDQFFFHACIGPCGLELCCKARPELFPEKIPIRLAKLQKLSYSPGKMSGMCGKPHCCMKYEAESYQEFADFLGIKPGAPFRCKGGDKRSCRVNDWDMLTNRVFVDCGEEEELVFTLEEFKRDYEQVRRGEQGKHQREDDEQGE